MAYLLFESSSGERGFIETTGVLVLVDASSQEVRVYERGSDSAICCARVVSEESLELALRWLEKPT